MSEVDWEGVQKAVVELLIERGSEEIARKLLESEWCEQVSYEQDWVGELSEVTDLDMRCVRDDYDALEANAEEVNTLIQQVLDGTGVRVRAASFRRPLPIAEPGWREGLRAVLRGDQARNQGNLVTAAPLEYNGLFFRSTTEIAISKALDGTAVLYFPLPVACYKGRKREPDFLVKAPSGKWGILEVQGDPYHPPSTAADDHERARAFERLGVKVQFFAAKRCWEDAPGVVQEFLRVMAAS